MGFFCDVGLIKLRFNEHTTHGSASQVLRSMFTVQTKAAVAAQVYDSK